AGLLLDYLNQVFLAIEEGGWYRYNKGMMSVANTGRSQIGAEPRRDCSRKNVIALPQSHRAAAHRLLGVDDPAVDLLVRNRIDKEAQIRRLGGARPNPSWLILDWRDGAAMAALAGASGLGIFDKVLVRSVQHRGIAFGLRNRS